MGFSILVRWHLYIESEPCVWNPSKKSPPPQGDNKIVQQNTLLPDSLPGSFLLSIQASGSPIPHSTSHHMGWASLQGIPHTPIFTYTLTDTYFSVHWTNQTIICYNLLDIWTLIWLKCGIYIYTIYILWFTWYLNCNLTKEWDLYWCCLNLR